MCLCIRDDADLQTDSGLFNPRATKGGVVATPP